MQISEAGLTWSERPDGVWEALTPSGRYEVSRTAMGYHAWYLPASGRYQQIGKFDTLGAAMQAARRYEPPARHAAECGCAEGDPCSHSHPPEVPSAPCDAAPPAPTTAATVTVAGEAAPVLHEALSTSTKDLKKTRRARKLGQIKTTKDVYELLHKGLAHQSQECCVVLPMDIQHQLIVPPVEVARGMRDGVAVNITDILAVVIANNANQFIIVHNHPSGKARPSPADLRLTVEVKKRTKAACPDVRFLDHVVIGDGQYYSIADERLYKA